MSGAVARYCFVSITAINWRAGDYIVCADQDNICSVWVGRLIYDVSYIEVTLTPRGIRNSFDSLVTTNLVADLLS